MASVFSLEEVVFLLHMARHSVNISHSRNTSPGPGHLVKSCTFPP